MSDTDIDTNTDRSNTAIENIFRSKHYDDVYFSAQDGLAETRYVFLDGNDLATRWQGLAGQTASTSNTFTIAETGFGTGLNFLAARKLWEETAPKDASLHFISVEKHPLDKQEIIDALTPWKEDINSQLQPFIANYPIDPNNDFTITFNDGCIKLTVLIGDAGQRYAEASKNQIFQADAWFLDGFSPSVNPDMWSDNLLSNIGTLSADSATLSSFTAAGFVRRALAASGFTIQKRKGYGRKREMIIGHKNGQINENK